MRTSIYLIFALVFFVGCDTSTPERIGLPYIGKHEVMLENADGLKKGDTLYHTIPEFSLLTQDSTLLSRSDIAGKVWVVKFFFSTCPTICPPMTSAMKEVYEELKPFSDDVVFLAFSIDPTKDTPSRLRAYSASHEIEVDNWYFLTGDDEEEMHRLGVEGFYIHAEADPYALGGYAHSPNFVLVDQNLHIRSIVDGLNKEERTKLVDAVKLLLEDGTGN